MSMVAVASRRKIESSKEQLLFGFVERCDVQSGRKPIAASRVKKTARVDFQEMCVFLHGLAQKHVSRSDFEDFTALVRCTKILTDLGLAIQARADLAAPVAAQDATLVTRDPKYRLLRNRAIACLATVADLSSKAPAKGSVEYQQGMRDAFQQASDIAVMFLEDIQNGV